MEPANNPLAREVRILAQEVAPAEQEYLRTRAGPPPAPWPEIISENWKKPCLSRTRSVTQAKEISKCLPLQHWAWCLSTGSLHNTSEAIWKLFMQYIIYRQVEHTVLKVAAYCPETLEHVLNLIQQSQLNTSLLYCTSISVYLYILLARSLNPFEHLTGSHINSWVGWIKFLTWFIL